MDRTNWTSTRVARGAVKYGTVHNEVIMFDATMGRTRGKYGGLIEDFSPAIVVRSQQGPGGWVFISKLENPPRDMQERYSMIYLEAR